MDKPKRALCRLVASKFQLPAGIPVSAAVLGAVLSACGSGHRESPAPLEMPAPGNAGPGAAGAAPGAVDPSAAALQMSGSSAAGQELPEADGAGQGGAPSAAVGAGGAEGMVMPVGLAGSTANPGATGSSRAGASGAGAAGAEAVSDCNTPPPPSPLVGWAAVPGLGVDTTTGGGDAAPTIVTSLKELQDAAQGAEPAVILIRGVLEPGNLQIGSNKTLIGSCGAEVHGHVEIREVSNVIVRNLTIVGYGEGDCTLDPAFDPAVGCSSGADAISVQRNAHHIWFDHCAVRDGTDGNLDITNGANFVTVSWTKFSYTPRTDDVGDDSTGAAGHRFSNLVGGTDSPSTFDDANALNVTWHHDWWADNVVERQPRVRFGKNHLFDNYYASPTTNYCVRAGKQAQILLEANYFDAVRNPYQFNSDTDQRSASIVDRDSNVYAGTTHGAAGGGGPAFEAPPYEYSLDDAAQVSSAVMSGAGPH